MRRVLAILATGLALGCASDPPAGRLAPEPCPERMVHLEALGVCIDRYEAALEGPGHPGTAVPAEGRLPATGVDWNGAVAACRRAGFRLCTAEEWYFACAGARLGEEGGRAFPYGDEFEAGRCNTVPDDEAATERGLVPGGSKPECVTPDGVFDMSGNAGEWLSTREAGLPEERGGNFSSYERYAHCQVRPTSIRHPEDFTSEVLGFRCCADAQH